MEGLAGLKGKVEALKKDKLRLYESYCGGEIDRIRYLEEKGEVDSEIGECEEKIKEMEAEVEAMETEIAEGDGGERDAVCRLFRDEKELTYDLAHAFVEKILVYQEERVEIVWKFKDVYGEG